jgi:ketosteroid isomerase-like protein
MSARDEEIIARLRRFYEAFNRGDYDAAMEIVHPSIEFTREMGTLYGAEAFRAWMRPEAFEEQQLEPVEFRVNGNRVLVRNHVRARGAGSGIDVDVDAWSVWTLDDDDLATRLVFFSLHQRTEALEAAGLAA